MPDEPLRRLLLPRADPRAEGGAGKNHGERGSSSRARTLSADRSLVLFHEIAREGEAETEAGVRSHDGAFALTKPLEQMRQQVRSDAFPGVADLKPDLRFRVAEAQLDGAAFGRELERVGQEIADHLL
jgi:hypothetical protein